MRAEITCPNCSYFYNDSTFVEKSAYDSLLSDARKLIQALNEISHPSHLRNMSQLACNPPKNGGVHDLQVVARKAIADFEKVWGKG